MFTIEDLEEIRRTKTLRHEIEDSIIVDLILCFKEKQQPPAHMAEPADKSARAGGVPARASSPNPSDRTPKRRYTHRQAPAGAGSELLKAVMSVLVEPFNIDDLRDAVKSKMPELLKERASSFLSGSLQRFHQQGFLLRRGTKNGLQAYTRGPEFKKPLSSKEEAYREFRSTIPTPTATV